MASNHRTVPRAVIHQQILDSAATQPDASMADLANEVAGASTELVERVLEEYGDPAGEAPPGEPTSEEEPMTEQSTPPSVAELTEKERETLRAVAERPDATQGELADRLEVSRATVNKRLNGIDGFEWRDRQAFVASLFTEAAAPSADLDASTPDTPASATTGLPAATASDGGQLVSPDLEGTIQDLRERVAWLEQQLDESATMTGSVLADSALVAKVVRAVVADEAISADEELRILEALL